MNLTSCEKCGVVIDKDQVVFPSKFNDDGTIDSMVCEWNGDGYIVYAPCPVCKIGRIYE